MNLRKTLNFMYADMKKRFQKMDMTNQGFAYGKPLSGKLFHKCRAYKLFDNIGIARLLDLLSDCYPNYILEFYANLHKDGKGNYVSFVRSRNICLNLTLLQTICRFDCFGQGDVFTSK